jgi:hypothetical protein
MFNEDVLDLYPRVPIGTKVTVTWDRFDTSGVIETASNSTTSSSMATTAGTSSKAMSGKAGTGISSSSSSSGGTLFDLFTDTSEPPRPAKGLTKFNRKVGGGSVSSAAQTTAQAN